MDNEIKAPGENYAANRVEPAQLTFFFERVNGQIFSVSEREAWTIYSGRIQTYVRQVPPKLIGASDGSLFQKAVIESHQMLKEGKTKEEIQERIRQGEREEIEAARLNFVRPRNCDTVDKHNQITQI